MSATAYIVLGALAVLVAIVGAVLIEYRRETKANRRRATSVIDGGADDRSLVG